MPAWCLWPCYSSWLWCLYLCRTCICLDRHQVLNCIYPEMFVWVAYQSWSKEHSQQSQTGSHHYEQQKHNKRMLLAHTVVGLIKPVRGLIPLVLTLSSSWLIPDSRCPSPVQKVPLPSYCLLPHGSWRRGGGGRTPWGGWGICTFQNRQGALHLPPAALRVSASWSPDLLFFPGSLQPLLF